MVPGPFSFCPKCGYRIVISFDNCDDDCDDFCDHCGAPKRLIRCLKKTCEFQRRICVSCSLKTFHESRNWQSESAKVSNDNGSLCSTKILLMAIFALVIVVLATYYNTCNENVDLLENLRKDFPSQRNETWYNILSVLEIKIPSVKSITFLHDGDKRTSDCLTSKLVNLYSRNESLKSEDITFSASGYEEKDYGFALEHYRTVVERFRVFVTDLTTVPGNIARIFHSLCDDESSDIKPSLFIFTLKYDMGTERLKPLKRAEAILKEAWNDLPGNEIYPLLSRVLKNVVDVVPEERVSC